MGWNYCQVQDGQGNSCERRITECQFADDSALLTSTRSGAVKTAIEYQWTSRDFGLTVSIPKADGNREACRGGRPHFCTLAWWDIDVVEEFPYLGSKIGKSGKVDMDVDRRIAQASKAFGALRKSVFMDKNLTLTTKRRLYDACVVSVLLYGAECCTPLRKHEKKLNTFHHRCIRTILGISNRKQWTEHITMEEIRRRWGDEELMTEKVKKRRLEWLGHLARMPYHRLPKCLLFDWLPQSRPRGGPPGRGGEM